MTSINNYICPACGGQLKHYSKVKRIHRERHGVKIWTNVKILICRNCGGYHRALPDYIIPYKHYEKQIIEGVIARTITPDTLGFEDYPSERTMSRWIKEFSNDFVCTN